MLRTRIALVGPGRSFRGGIAEHTVALGERLRDLGVLSEHASWGRQFPRILHPGSSQTGPGPTSENLASLQVIQETRDLHWNRPDTWIRVARRLRRDAERLVVVVTSPLQMPAIFALSRVFRGGDPSRDVIAIVHNVIPHETTKLDPLFMRGILREVDTVIVHSRKQGQLAATIGAQSVRIAALPFHPPPGLRTGKHPAGEQRMDALAFIGFIRPYKGLDVLLLALSQTRAKPQLLVRGEFWEPVERYQALIQQLGLSDRIVLHPGYASAAQLSQLLGSVDALVLPYRSGTSSQQPRIGFACGVPAIVTDVGDLADQIANNTDGLVARCGDPSDLARAIDTLYSENCWLKLRQNVTRPNENAEWQNYVDALTH